MPPNDKILSYAWLELYSDYSARGKLSMSKQLPLTSRGIASREELGGNEAFNRLQYRAAGCINSKLLNGQISRPPLSSHPVLKNSLGAKIWSSNH